MMHYPDTPHRNNEHSHPVPAARSGLLPSQRPAADHHLIDEATTEVPVIRRNGTLPPQAEETDAEETTQATETDTEPDAATAEVFDDAEAGDEAADDEAGDDEATAIAPWADLTGPAPAGVFGRPDADADAVDAEAAAAGVAGDADAVDATAQEIDPDAEADLDPEDEVEIEIEVEVVTDAAADAEPAAETDVVVTEVAETDPAETDVAEAEAPAAQAPEARALETQAPETQVAETEVAETEGPGPVVTDGPDHRAAETDLQARADTDAEAATDAETDTTDQEGADVLVDAETTTEEATAPASSPPGRPGDVAEEPIAVWSEEEAQRLREEWRDLQVLFIDEPGTAVTGAKRLVTDAVNTLSENLLAEQDQFDPHQQSEQPDTEAMRVAMRRYREFLDRVLAL